MTSSDGQSRRPARTSCDSRCVRAPVSDDPRIAGAGHTEHIVRHDVQIPRRAAVARPQVRWSARAGRNTPSERRVGRPDGHRDERTLYHHRRRELVCHHLPHSPLRNLLRCRPRLRNRSITSLFFTLYRADGFSWKK